MNNSRALVTHTAATEIIEEGKSTFQVACWSKSKPTTLLMMRVIAIKRTYCIHVCDTYILFVLLYSYYDYYIAVVAAN